MKKSLNLLLVLMSLSLQVIAAPRYGHFESSGDYLVAGHLKRIDGQLKLVIWPETQSEIVLSLSKEANDLGRNLVDHSVEIQGCIDHLDGSKGKMSIVHSIEYRVPNPLYPLEDGGFISQGKKTCHK